MSAQRRILLALCLLAPAISYRVGGSGLWAMHGGACVLAAALSLWLLHEDGMLVGAIQYRSADFTVAIVAAAVVYLPVAAIMQWWIAPSEPDNLLRLCTARGAWIPRPDVHGLGVASEWIRNRACEAFARSAGVRGWQRGALVLLIAAAEETAWRVGVQRMLAERFGRTRGWLFAAALFGLAHAGTGNVTVGALAFFAGLVFGGLYIVRASPSTEASDDDEGGAASFSSMHLGQGRLLPCLVAHCAFSWFFFYQQPLFAIRADAI
jgi:Type II CAAX prenyl endopeptidase Rce1-like